MHPSVSTASLGVAAPASPIFSFAQRNGRGYVVTRSVDPTRLGVLDLSEESVVDHCEFPSGDGAWSAIALGDEVYLGMYRTGELYRYDTATGELALVTSFPDDTHVCDLDALNGTLYAGTYPTASIHAYDPSADDTRTISTNVGGESYVRGLAATEDAIYAGVGSRAGLFAVDPDTGRSTDVLPAELDDESFAYDVVRTKDHIIVRTSPSNRLAIVDQRDADRYLLPEPDGKHQVGTITVDDNVLYLTARGDSEDGRDRLYRYDLADDAFELLGDAPYDAGMIAIDRGAVVGASSDGMLWRFDPHTGESSLVDLMSAGMPAGAEVPFSIELLQGVPIVAGHRRLHIHDPESDDPRRVIAPGEAKAMTAVSGTLYLAFYPGAKIATYDPEYDEIDGLTTIGHEQNRPRTVHYQRSTDLLLVGTVPEYGHLGGAAAAYNLETGDLAVHRDVVPDQSIRAITSNDETAYLGSEIAGGVGIEPVASEARVAGWDPAAQTKLWSIAPVDGAETIADLVFVGGLLYGATVDGVFFVVDPADHEVLHTESVAEDMGPMTVYDGTIYGVTTGDLLRFDIENFEANTVLEGLDPHHPMIAAGDEGIYLLQDNELVRVSIDGAPL